MKYLGHVLTNDLLDYEDVMTKKGEFIRSVNRLNAQFHNVQADNYKDPSTPNILHVVVRLPNLVLRL